MANEEKIYYVKHKERGVSAVQGKERYEEALAQKGFQPATQKEWHEHIGYDPKSAKDE